MNEIDTESARARASRRSRRSALRFSKEVRSAIKALVKPSAWRAFAAIASDWIQIGLAGYAIYWAIWLSSSALTLIIVPFAWVVIGSRQRALATILHEASHQALTRWRWLNFVMGTLLSGWWILQLHGRYFRSHVQGHHPWLGDVERDPDIKQYHGMRLLNQDPKTFFKRNLIQLLFGLKTFVNLPYLLRDRLLPEPGTVQTRGEKLEIAGFVAIWATLLVLLISKGWLLLFVLIWVVPYLSTFQAINHLIETLEHFPLTWSRLDSIEWTRNRKGPWIEQWLTGAHGENWHRVHHLFPALPFWNLKRAHALLMTDPAYAALEIETSGIFFAGLKGEPAIITQMIAEMSAYQQAHFITIEENKL